MLYKKGDHTDPANFRPIGLNNTMGKLWTAMVTTSIACYAENMGILSSAQVYAGAQFLVVCQVCGGPIIDTLDYVYGICAEAKVIHNAHQLVMVYHVEARLT